MHPILSPDEYGQFRSLVESQTPRTLKRYLDCGKRLQTGKGLGELRQWLGKILLDDGAVYGVEDRALAFEISAGLAIAARLRELQEAKPEAITLAGDVDKIRLYRYLLDSGASAARRSALADLLKARYRKAWSWIEDCSASAALQTEGEDAPADRLTGEFLRGLDELDPLNGSSDSEAAVAALSEEIEDNRKAIERLEREVVVARDRADRALERLESGEEESGKMRKRLQEERDNGDKLRVERSRRIKLEREARQAGQNLETLRAEYVKLDNRLREMARRAPSSATVDAASAKQIDLAALRTIDAAELLGLGSQATEEEVSKIRRRFATAFHPDRINQLPSWVAALFDQLLGIVNERCDKAGRK